MQTNHQLALSAAFALSPIFLPPSIPRLVIMLKSCGRTHPTVKQWLYYPLGLISLTMTQGQREALPNPTQKTMLLKLNSTAYNRKKRGKEICFYYVFREC